MDFIIFFFRFYEENVDFAKIKISDVEFFMENFRFYEKKNTDFSKKIQI